MSREPFDHALADELEQELRQSLAIEPSPDFARHVRARIEQTSADRVPNVRRWPAALAAAAACIFAIGIGWRATQPSAIRPDAPSAARVGSDVDLAPAAPMLALPPASRPPGRNAVRQVAPVRPPVEVIVSPDRAEALSRLLRLARSGVVDEETLRPAVAASVPPTLSVMPLAVPAIPVPEIDIQLGAARDGATRE